MNIAEATQALTDHIAEHLHHWNSAPDYELPSIYGDTNYALDEDENILPHETLDDLYAAYSDAATAERRAHDPRNPAGSSHTENTATRAVHDYLDAATHALRDAGYTGDPLLADTLTEITA